MGNSCVISLMEVKQKTLEVTAYGVVPSQAPGSKGVVPPSSPDSLLPPHSVLLEARCIQSITLSLLCGWAVIRASSPIERGSPCIIVKTEPNKKLLRKEIMRMNRLRTAVDSKKNPEDPSQILQELMKGTLNPQWGNLHR